VTVSLLRSPPREDIDECNAMSSLSSEKRKCQYNYVEVKNRFLPPLRYIIPWWGPSTNSKSLAIGHAKIPYYKLVHILKRHASDVQEDRSGLE
jgi:hypothetical protein